MRGTLPTLLLALSLALAGCGTPPAPPADDPFDDDPAKVSSGKGVIRGLVIDSNVVPVEGASVVAGDLSTVSDGDGLFRFVDVEPGVHFLQVSKDGWTSVQVQATVVADVAKPEILRVIIDLIPGAEARAETYQDVGFIACGWGVPITYYYCGDMLGQEDDYRLQYGIRGAPDFIQVEILWESTQTLSDNLYMINAVCPPADYDRCPGSTPFPSEAPYRWGEGTYQSPAIMRSPAGHMQAARDYHQLPSMENWTVGVDVSADGPLLATGVAIDQEFRGYVTLFWNIEPREGWTFVENGEYVP